jgi:hypothetical protein
VPPAARWRRRPARGPRRRARAASGGRGWCACAARRPGPRRGRRGGRGRAGCRAPSRRWRCRCRSRRRTCRGGCGRRRRRRRARRTTRARRWGSRGSRRRTSSRLRATRDSASRSSGRGDVEAGEVDGVGAVLAASRWSSSPDCWARAGDDDAAAEQRAPLEPLDRAAQVDDAADDHDGGRADALGVDAVGELRERGDDGALDPAGAPADQRGRGRQGRGRRRSGARRSRGNS